MSLLSPSFGVFFWQFITIFLVIVILRVFVYKIIINSLEKRKETIESAIANSAEIEKRLENMKSLENNLETEILQKEKKKLEDIDIIKNELLEKTKLDVQNEKLKMLDNLNKEIEEQRLKFEKECDIKISNIMLQYAKKFLTRGSEDKKKQDFFLGDITTELDNNHKTK